MNIDSWIEDSWANMGSNTPCPLVEGSNKANYLSWRSIQINRVDLRNPSDDNDDLAALIGFNIFIEKSLEYLEIGTIELIIPGVTLQLTHFLPGAYGGTSYGFVRHEGKWYVTFIIGNQPSIFAVYIPDSSVVYISNYKGVGQGIAEGLLAELDLLIVTRGAELFAFLQNPVSRVGLQVANRHIGHHLWNELSGIEYLLKSRCAEKIEIVYTTDVSNIYSPLEKIFPLFAGKVVVDNGVGDRITRILADRISIIPYGAAFISAALADRLLMLARESDGQLLNSLLSDAGSLALKVLIGLRVENRYWIDQASGYVSLIRRLVEKFHSVAIVFDGHNCGCYGAKIRSFNERLSSSDEEMASVIMERSIVAFVRNDLSDLIESGAVYIADTILMPVNASIMAAMWCDFYISHWGAGLAKYKWIANRPGIVFSARHVLQNKVDVRIYENPRIREGATSHSHVPIDLIEDVVSESTLVKSQGSNYLCFRMNRERFEDFVLKWVADRNYQL